ncbi:IDEAL domain-containing protein [Bacillus sp. ISL-75]|uniref:IDEAL domain-containing protein n=1 Tax=Bacillus sp. ISL-75 TaxID=2819137 RepID=UPI001BE9C34C|nr:IDEAL domain-containing protein [Bacillus sp. ISL-75]MBT2730032.1 IDEAL domain-containing protein [Bacillus sp. ISL-75]
MTMADNNRFENGDWVHGRSKDGELIQGYVETVDSHKEMLQVNVVDSDNEKVIGKSIWILNKRAEKLPELTGRNESELLALIDLALLFKDEQWFMELSAKLASSKKIPKVNNKKSEYKISGNRIRDLDAKR